MKKIGVIFICLALMFALEGCGENNNNESDTEVIESNCQENYNQEFSSINLSITDGSITISLGDALSLTYLDGTEVEYSITDDILYISLEDFDDMILTLPSDNSYDVVTMSVERGQIDMEEVLDAYQLSLDVNNGEITLKDISVNNSCDMNVYQGTIYLYGTITNTTASCREGHIEIDTSYKQTDYNYELSTSNGGITLGDDYYGEDQSISNEADYTMTLSSTSANIAVGFNE